MGCRDGLVGGLAFVGVMAACSDPATKPGPAVVTGTPPTAAGSGGGGDGGSEGGTTGDAGGADGGLCTDLAATVMVVDRVGVLGPPTATEARSSTAPTT